MPNIINFICNNCLQIYGFKIGTINKLLSGFSVQHFHIVTDVIICRVPYTNFIWFLMVKSGFEMDLNERKVKKWKKRSRKNNSKMMESLLLILVEKR